MAGRIVSCAELEVAWHVTPDECAQCVESRVTDIVGQPPLNVLCLSTPDYIRAGFDPAVYGPPGTCWWFTLSDVAIQCGIPPGASVWWIQAFESLGLYRWVVPMRWIRANVMGTIGTDETFVHALSLNAGSDTSWVDSTALHDIAVVVAAAFDNFMSDNGGFWPASVVYREVGCSLLEQTSVGGDIDTVLITEFAPINGTDGRAGISSEHQLPNEVSCGVSLETATRGRRGRGRFYLPPPVVTELTAGGRWTPTFASGIADYIFEHTLPALQPTGAPYAWAVRSGKDLALYDITGVRVSNVPDSQRRRRRSEVPVYSVGA